MYCAACDRWEYDQLAVEDCICLRCWGPLIDPDDDDDGAGRASLAEKDKANDR